MKYQKIDTDINYHIDTYFLTSEEGYDSISKLIIYVNDKFKEIEELVKVK